MKTSSNIKITDNILKEKLDDLKEYLSLSYTGTITLDLSEKEVDKNSLYYRWNKYLKKYENDEEPFLSDWSPSNGTHPLIQSNKILSSVVESYYDYAERHKSVDMIALLSYYFDDNYDFSLDDYTSGKVSDSYPEIDEALEFYMERNPYFRMDW